MVVKWKFTSHDFDVLMFCDDMVYFTKTQFEEGMYWGDWNHDRFQRLMELELITRLEGTGTGRGNPSKYKLGLLGRIMVTNIYKMCYEEKEIPEAPRNNPLMKSKTYLHGKMQAFILKHNKRLRHERRKKYGNE